MNYETALNSVQPVYERLRTSTLTQLAALLFGGLAGFLFMQVFQGTPPALTSVVIVLGALLGAIMTAALDALTPQKNRRRHAAWYIIGLVVGAAIMFFLITIHVATPLKGVDPSTSPTPSVSPTPASAPTSS